MRRNVQDVSNVVFLVKADPAHTEPFGASGKPHVLNGAGGGHQVGFGNGISPKDMGPAAGRIGRDADRERGLHKTFDFDAKEAFFLFVLIVDCFARL